MRANVERFVEVYVGTPLGRHLTQLIGEAQSDPELAKGLYENWFNPRRQPMRDRLLAAQRTGELNPDLDVDAVIDAIYGPLQYRTLLAYAPVTADYARQLVDVLLRGVTGRRRQDDARAQGPELATQAGPPTG